MSCKRLYLPALHLSFIPFQELSSRRSDGQQLTLRALECGHKLSQLVSADAGLSLTNDVTQLSNTFDAHCRRLDSALERLSGKMGASNSYLKCVENVRKWLVETEKNVSEAISRVDKGAETGLLLEQLRNLLSDLEHNQRSLKELNDLEKKCQISSSQQVFSIFSTKYDGLLKQLKVC